MRDHVGSMQVAVALFELHIPYAQSLKDKRMIVKSVRDKLRARFEISVAEVGLHDVHQRARVAVSFVANDHVSAESLLAKVRHFVETSTDAMLNGWTNELLDFDEDAPLV